MYICICGYMCIYIYVCVCIYLLVLNLYLLKPRNRSTKKYFDYLFNGFNYIVVFSLRDVDRDTANVPYIVHSYSIPQHMIRTLELSP